MEINKCEQNFRYVLENLNWSSGVSRNFWGGGGGGGGGEVPEEKKSQKNHKKIPSKLKNFGNIFKNPRKSKQNKFSMEEYGGKVSGHLWTPFGYAPELIILYETIWKIINFWSWFMELS